MKNEYLERIEKLESYNDYREEENEKHLKKLLKNFKKNISQCGSCSSAVGFCEQFIHDIEWYEQQNAICGEIRRMFVGIEIDFEKMEENK